MTAMLEVEDLTKTFVKGRSLQDLFLRPFKRARRHKAVENANLTVRQGEILGLLGLEALELIRHIGRMQLNQFLQGYFMRIGHGLGF